MILRIVQAQIEKRLKDKKAIILLGPRQVGKTTLLKTFVSKGKEVLWWNGDDAETRYMIENPNSSKLKKLIGHHKILVIDEAQRIENIGLCIKLITDNIEGVKVFATGSSAFELSNKINEPLTGRKWEYTLYPFSFEELANHSTIMEESRLLEHRMIYGYYPEVVNNPGDEQEILQQLSNSYLYKDILTWERIQKPDKMERLVQALAFQVGNEVSYHELGQMAGLNNETVENYINLLEKAFIVFRLGTFSRNLRNELKKSRKIYFYDNGLRNDVGALWENFMVAERMKYCAYHQIYHNRYFWRNHAQNEIDLIEERDGKLFAYELKWSPKAKVKFPKAFVDAYEPDETKVITRENYQEFIYEKIKLSK